MRMREMHHPAGVGFRSAPAVSVPGLHATAILTHQQPGLLHPRQLQAYGGQYSPQLLLSHGTCHSTRIISTLVGRATAPAAEDAADTAPKRRRRLKTATPTLDTDAPAAPAPATKKRGRKSSTRPTDKGVQLDMSALPTLAQQDTVASTLRPSALASPPASAPRPTLQFSDLRSNLPRKGHPAWSKRHWVVFSDLHVTEKSWGVCSQVLDKVLQEAEQRDAGVLFLGDFWHQREKVEFKLLNVVMAKMREFSDSQVPLLMLVGNHDQVDFSGTDHGLTCLEGGMIHVFTHPTLFRDALWLPYRRDEEQIKLAIEVAKDGLVAHRGSSAGQEVLRAVMAHADVATAQYNAQYQAQDGLPVDTFPPDIPVWTGHYHMPHTVARSTITYIGSPYQVSRGEAGQQKRLLVLDAEQGWQLVEEVPLSLGTRYHQFNYKRGALPSTDGLGPGHEVKLKVTSDMSEEDIQRAKQQLEATGARVVLDVEQLQSTSRPRFQQEDASPEHLLQAYAESRAPGELSDAGLAAAQQAVKDCLGTMKGPPRAGGHVNLKFKEVEMEGFGPFKKRVAYSLDQRGLRIVTGRNEDDASLDMDVAKSSNGSGKSTLVSAPLWALTGELTTRTESGGSGSVVKVGSVVNDECNMAEVIVRGEVNGESFVVVRSVKKNKGTSALKFFVGEEDLTRQDKSATQAVIDERLCTSLLRHQVFFGQNDITTLLEARDREFKAWLSHVVEMDIWSSAEALMASTFKSLKQQVSKQSGEVDALTRAVTSGEDDLAAARQDRDKWELTQERTLSALRDQVQALVSKAGPVAAQVVAASAPVGQLWERLVRCETRRTQARDALIAAGASLPPQPALPPPPQQADTARLLAEQRQRLSGPGSAVTVPLQQLQAVDFQQLEVEAELTVRQLEQELAELQHQQQHRLGELHRAHDQQRHQEHTLEQELWNRIKCTDWHNGGGNGEAPLGSERHEQEMTRRHAEAKVQVDAINHELKKRHKQLKHAGGTCESCGQPVDAAHVRQHIAELEAQSMEAVRKLKEAGAALKDAQTQHRAAGDAYIRLQQQHRDQEQQRFQQVSDLNEQTRLQEQVIQQRMLEARTRVSEVRQKVMAEQQKRDRALRAEEDALHRQCMQEWERQVDQITLAHKQQTADAQAAFKEQVAAAQQQVQLVQSALGRLQGWQDEVADFKHWFQDVLGQSLAEPPMQAPGGFTAESGGVDTAVLQQLALEADRACSAFRAAMEQADEVLEALQSAQEELSRKESEANPLAQKLQWMEGELVKRRGDLAAAQAALEDLTAQRDAAQEAAKALGREGVQSFVLEGVLKHLEERSGEYLKQLSETLMLELNAYRPRSSAARASSPSRSVSEDEEAAAQEPTGAGGKGKKKRTARSKKASSPGVGDRDELVVADKEGVREQIEKVVWVRHPDGSDRIRRELTQLSGGERRRVALALALGFSALIRDKGKLTCNLLVLDEGLQQLDEPGCHSMVEILREMNHDTTLVVAQAGSFILSQEFSGVDVVVKNRRCASIEVEGTKTRLAERASVLSSVVARAGLDPALAVH